MAPFTMISKSQDKLKKNNGQFRSVHRSLGSGGRTHTIETVIGQDKYISATQNSAASKQSKAEDQINWPSEYLHYDGEYSISPFHQIINLYGGCEGLEQQVNHGAKIRKKALTWGVVV